MVSIKGCTAKRLAEKIINFHSNPKNFAPYYIIDYRPISISFFDGKPPRTGRKAIAVDCTQTHTVLN